VNGGVTLVFDELPPGLNGRKGLLRMHWTARQQLNQKWHWLVLDAYLRAAVRPEFDPQHPCEVVAVRYDTRLMDWDNFGASLKPVFDGMVGCGLLYDDGPGVVRSLTLRQVHVTHRNGAKLVVRVMPENKEA
jgi:hypothetical protein